MQTQPDLTSDHILAWLAAQPCPKCEGVKGWTAVDGEWDDCPTCKYSGLAFEWASKVCVRTARVGGREVFLLCKGTEDCQCGGSGRVPKKDVRLEELMEAKPWAVHEALAVEHAESLSENRRPDYVLAALHAVAVQAGMPCAS